MTLAEAKRYFLKLQTEIISCENLNKLLYYDAEITAPAGSAASRRNMIVEAEHMRYQLFTAPEVQELVNVFSEHQEKLDYREKQMLYLFMRKIKEITVVPEAIRLQFQTVRNEAYAVWHEAKARDDFLLLLPYLERIFALAREISEYQDPGRPAYNVWLDQYEDGLDMERCDLFFEKLRMRIAPLVKQFASGQSTSVEIPKAIYPKEDQRRLADFILDIMRLDRRYCVLAESEHPGTTSMSKYDVRITTCYRPQTFLTSMLMVMHEGGHALYDLHTAKEDVFTFLGTYASMGIYEGQARFYENIIGRSESFLQYIMPKLRQLFPEQLKELSEKQLYQAVNHIEPSASRMEADELTYSLHIMIRYELEKAMFDGSLAVKDLPDAWNDLYRRYLGVTVRSDREGVLQDPHWAYGSIGYFPSYALGNAYGVQILHQMRRDINVDNCVAHGEFEQINSWMEDKLWRFGARFDPVTTLENVWKEPFNPELYINYLENKYKIL